MPDLTLKMVLLGDASSAGAALKSLATKTSSLPTQLAGPLSKMGSLIGGEVGELVEKLSTGLENLGEEGSNIGKKFAAGGAALAGIGAAGALIGSKDKASLQQLKTAITDTGSSYSDYSEEIEKTISKQENFGNSAVSTQDALATLTAATQDPKKAIEEMGVTADLAAAKHISLTDAATLMAKVLNGSGSKTLKAYGITTKDMTLATEQLAQKLKGQASASVDSWSGKLDVLKTKIGDQVAIMGQKYGPVLAATGTALSAMGTVTAFLQARQEAAAVAQAAAATATEASTLADTENVVATEAQTVATEGQSFASKAAAAAQWLLNIAMDANPIALIIIAVLALVAAIVLIATKTKWFQEAWTAAWGFIKTAALDVWNWVKSNWPLILAILTGPIGLAVLAIVKNWGTIKDAFSAVKDWIKARIDDIVGFFTGLGKRITSGVSGAFKGVGAAFTTLYNNSIGPILNAIEKIQSFLSSQGSGPSFGLVAGQSSAHSSTYGSQVPKFAAGGIVNSPTFGLIGEAGPEAIIPLNRARGMFGGGSQTISVTVELGGQAIIRHIENVSNNGGPVNFKIRGVNA